MLPAFVYAFIYRRVRFKEPHDTTKRWGLSIRWGNAPAGSIDLESVGAGGVRREEANAASEFKSTLISENW